VCIHLNAATVICQGPFSKRLQNGKDRKNTMNGNGLAVASAEKSFRSARMRLHEQILPMHMLMARPSAVSSHRPFSESTLNGVAVWVPFSEIV
jgi:hypothetical protein